MAKPKSIPIFVDAQTHERLAKIARACGFGQRGLGAVVRKLVGQEYARLLAAQLVAEEPQPSAPQQPV